MLHTFSSPKHALSVGGTTVKTSEFPLQSVVSFSFIVNLHSRLDKVGFLSTYCMISSSVNTLLQIAISSTYRSGCDGSVGLYQEEKAKKLERALDICMYEEKKYQITGRDTGVTGAEFADYVMAKTKSL